MRLVIVDNDPVALDLAVTDLALEGHEIVATGTDGEQAVTCCAIHQPDVLVIDLRMPPGIDGIEAAARVLAVQPGLRVVLHTNHVERRALARAEQLGAVYLLKGDLRALRRAVQPGTEAPAAG